MLLIDIANEKKDFLLNRRVHSAAFFKKSDGSSSFVSMWADSLAQVEGL